MADDGASYGRRLVGGNVNRYQALSAALAVNAGKSVRAEDLESYSEFFVDPINTDILLGNANQLVYGRRGSGKTLLLGTLNDRIRTKFPGNKTVSFYYTAVEFRSSAEYGGMTPTVKDKTHAFFHSFIQQLCDDVVSLADDVLFKRLTWLQTFTLAGDEQAASRDKLLSSVVQLLDAAAYGVDDPSPTSLDTRIDATQSQRRSAGRSAELGLAAKIGPDPSGSASAGAKLERKRESSKEVATKVVQHAPRRFSPGRIRELITEIVEVLNLECMVIFIDEWMSLGECQIEFAERLRQCLFGDRRIAVKIAADQFQGQFNNSGEGHNFRGLEVGGDVFVAVDLDRPFRQPDRGRELYAEALYRRLMHFEPTLEEHFGPPPLVNRDRFLDSLFASKRAFDELCLASSGLCRDFHVLFQACAKRVNWTVGQGEGITTDIVRRAIVEKTEQTYDRAIRSIDSNTLLFRVISPHIAATKSRYFLVESKPGSHTSVMNDLLSKRIIHSIPSALLDPSIRGEYDCFEIDYGIFIDLMRAAEYSTGVSVDEGYNAVELRTINSGTKAAYLVDLAPLRDSQQGADLLRCPECELEFSSNDKAYVVRKICPHCFQDQPTESVSTDH